jgi:hypothetical protein
MAPRSGASTTPAPRAEVPARRDWWVRALAVWNLAAFAARIAAPFAVAGKVVGGARWAHLGAVANGPGRPRRQ